MKPLKAPIGDGVADDTDAIEAYINADEPVPGGQFRITRTIHVRSGLRIRLQSAVRGGSGGGTAEITVLDTP